MVNRVRMVLQVAEFFEVQVGPVAKINVQRDCRRLIALGHARHDARLAAERCVQRLLRACMHSLHAGSVPPPAAAAKPSLTPPALPTITDGPAAATSAAGAAAASPVTLDPAPGVTTGSPGGRVMRTERDSWMSCLCAGRQWSEIQIRREAARLKGLEHKVDSLATEMEQESERPRSIVSAFVTFKCVHTPPSSRCAFKNANLGRPARSSHSPIHAKAQAGHRGCG